VTVWLTFKAFQLRFYEINSLADACLSKRNELTIVKKTTTMKTGATSATGSSGLTGTDPNET
jgi:hypothetical protein